MRMSNKPLYTLRLIWRFAVERDALGIEETRIRQYQVRHARPGRLRPRIDILYFQMYILMLESKVMEITFAEIPMLQDTRDFKEIQVPSGATLLIETRDGNTAFHLNKIIVN
jgi:hypothetical protein